MKLTIDHAVKRFGSVVALNGVSLEIDDAELFFLLGPSGCGKTTLLRAVAGFQPLDSGRICFDAADVSAVPPHRRNTGMMFQGYALWPHMSVAENVAFGLEVRGLSRAERDMRVRRALERVRIAELAERKPNQLSGGQQQRVALARTLVIEPACLLLDEPLANLDAQLRLEMRSEIRRLCKELGLTALYVTHDQKEALAAADRLAVMDRGRVLQVGTPRELYRHPASAFVAAFMGETNLLPGVVRTGADDTPEVECAGTRFRAVPFPAGLRGGQAVRLSIRPEAWRVQRPAAGAGAPGANALSARVVESLYLGGMAQYTVEADGVLRISVLDVNPREAVPPGTALLLQADPADVVVLADDA
jgi:iron(III) transport system ATP-binding protein